MPQRVTTYAQRVFHHAVLDGGRLGQKSLATDVLLLGILQEPDSAAGRVLARFGLDREALQRDLEDATSAPEYREFRSTLTALLDHALAHQIACEEKERLNSDALGTLHLLAGVLRDTETAACRVLQQTGVDVEALRTAALAAIEPKGAGDGGLEPIIEPIARSPRKALAALRNRNDQDRQRALLDLWMFFSRKQRGRVEPSGPDPDAPENLGIEAEALPALIAALDDSSRNVQALAARTLATLGPAASGAVPVLLQMMKDREAPRGDALGALTAIDSTALSRLDNLPELMREPSGVGVAAAATFWKVTAQAEPVLSILIGALEDDDWNARRLAVQTLADMGPAASKAVPALVDRLRDKRDVLGMHEVTAALAQMGSAAVSAVPALLEMIRTSPRERGALSAAVVAIAERASSEVLPLFQDALRDPVGEVRRCAIVALGAMGPAEAAAAAPALHSLLDDSDRHTRVFAAGALWKLEKCAGVIPLLIASLEHSGEHVAEAATNYLGEIGPEARAAIPHLETTVKNGTSERRIGAARALWKITRESDPLVPIFIEALSHKHWLVRFSAVSALAEIGPAAKEAIPALLALRKDEDPSVRHFVLRTIAQIEPGLACKGDEPSIRIE